MLAEFVKIDYREIKIRTPGWDDIFRSKFFTVIKKMMLIASKVKSVINLNINLSVDLLFQQKSVLGPTSRIYWKKYIKFTENYYHKAITIQTENGIVSNQFNREILRIMECGDKLT